MKTNRFKSIKRKGSNGQTLVELVIAIGMLAIILPALLTGIVASRSGKAQQDQRMQADALLKQTEETVRSIRDRDWSTFAVDGTYHPSLSGNIWTLVTGSDTVNGITRQVVIGDVYRDNSGAIVTSGGTLDPSTKKIDITISWNSPNASSVSSTSYLTRYLQNNAFLDTLVSDFNAAGSADAPGSVETGVTVRATTGSSLPGDGEVVLGAGGNGNWCQPSLLANASQINGQGSQKAMYASQGNAYFGAGGNRSADTFDHMTISDPPSPTLPVARTDGTYNNYKSYGIFGDATYAYLTSDHPGVTLDIVNIASPPSYTHFAYANAGSAGNSIYVLNNIGYVTTQDNHLYTFNFSGMTLNSTLSPIGSVGLAGVGNKVVVIGNTAYIATTSTTSQLQLVQVANNGATLTVSKSINLGNGQPAQDMFINSTGTRAYIVTSYVVGKNDFFIVDTDPTSPTYGQVKGQYSTNGMNPSGISVVPGNDAVIGGSGGETYQVVDLSNESTPTHCGGLTLSFNIYALASVLESDGDAFTYLLTSDTSAEFKMLEGGPGGTFSTSGTFESHVFDPGFSTANNRFTADYQQPSGTTIKFQVSMAQKVGGVCPTNGNYTYVGPDSTTNTYFTPASGTAATFPFGTTAPSYTNPGECMRYKAFLSTTNQNSTPVLNDVTLNYSP